MIRFRRYEVPNSNIVPTIQALLHSALRTLRRNRQPFELRLTWVNPRHNTRGTTTGRRCVDFLLLKHFHFYHRQGNVGPRNRQRRRNDRFFRLIGTLLLITLLRIEFTQRRQWRLDGGVWVVFVGCVLVLRALWFH